MKILLTGGAGYIGSHVAVELIGAGYSPVIVDNLSNSSAEAIKRIQKITGQDVSFYKVDLLDKDELENIFKEHEIDAVVHMAGLKAVGESVEKPLEYYQNNLIGTMNLLEIMHAQDVKKILFSSSATVYGDPEDVPITEEKPARRATNPYGWTKAMIEQMLEDVAAADETWQVTLLRYFNPVGAHESGLIGESPCGIPNNLMPYITQVAVGKLDELSVYGDDYETVDGTGVRDYIHVVDLAKGHVAAIEHMKPGTNVYNLGTSQGYSVLQIIKAFETANNIKIPYKIVARRPGDIAEAYADASKAMQELNWKTEKTIEDACRDSWRWQKKNPDGI